MVNVVEESLYVSFNEPFNPSERVLYLFECSMAASVFSETMRFC